MKTLHKIRALETFILFLFVVLFFSLFFGGIKFTLKNISLPLFPEFSEKLLLEKILGYLSLGGGIAYALGGALGNIFSKRIILFSTAFLIFLILLFHFFFSLHSYTALVIVCLMVGFLYSFFCVLSNSLVYIEIIKTGFPDTLVNALTTSIFLAATIGGVVLSTKVFEYDPSGNIVFVLFMSFLLLISTVSFFLNYSAFDTKHSFKHSVVSFVTDTLFLFRAQGRTLITVAILWAVATVVGIIVIPLITHKLSIAESFATTLLGGGAGIGAIIGNIFTAQVKRRSWWFSFYVLLFAFLLLAFHNITFSIYSTALSALIMGIAIGGSTNIIDSYYITFVGEAHKKENGSALFGVLLNSSTGILSLSAEHIPHKYLFYVLGGLLLLVLLLQAPVEKVPS